MFEFILNNLRNKVARNYRIKKLFYLMLGTAIFTKNPIYIYLYLNSIKKKIKSLEKKPDFVIIENTNLCNISCIFCANEQMKRKRGFIDDNLFKSIIDQCAFYGISNVLIQGFGEPLLDKEYVSKVSYAKNKGIGKVHCVTNGILLNKEISEELINCGLDFLYISIDAASAETYGSIHRIPGVGYPSNKFIDVVKNIDDLISLKREKKKTKPFIEVRFKDFDINKSDLNSFIKKYSNKVDNINIYMNITNWPGSTIENNLPSKAPIIKFPCYNLWSTLFIAYDGSVAICCQDYECRVKIGDIRLNSLMDIWQGQTLQQLRKNHLEKRFDAIEVCRDCIVNSHFVSPWW